MPNYVLVHGAWQGAWSWEGVSHELQEAQGSDDPGKIIAMDLPGHGRRSEDEIRRITVEHYVQAVATPIQVERLEDVVLVGHGFAATFLPQVAIELGERVKRVVFIAGELPPEGKPAYDRLPSWDKMMLKMLKAEEKGFKFPDFIFKAKLCKGLDGDSTRQILSRLVADPFMPWMTPVSRQGFAGNFPTTYIVLNRDNILRPRLQRVYIQSLGSPDIEELEAGHGAVFSHAGEIARLILKHAG